MEPEPPPITILEDIMCELVDICDNNKPLELNDNICFNTRDGQDERFAIKCGSFLPCFEVLNVYFILSSLLNDVL